MTETVPPAADKDHKGASETSAPDSTTSSEPFKRVSRQFERPSLGKAETKYLAPLSKVLRGSTSGTVEAAEVTKAYLNANANWAAHLLLELSKGENASAYDKLKPAVVNSCEALAFINAAKGGLALSLASGYGFMIKKTSQDIHGNSTWSMPVFFNVSQAGFGVTAGYQHSQSVIAVLAVGALDVFKKGTRSLGSDLGLFSTDGALTGMSGGAALGDSQHLGMSVDHERSAFCYSKVDGVYLELSAHTSSVSPDRESNASLYGEQYDADVVLNEADSYKHEMMPLYAMINHLGKVAVRGDEHAVPS